MLTQAHSTGHPRGTAYSRGGPDEITHPDMKGIGILNRGRATWLLLTSSMLSELAYSTESNTTQGSAEIYRPQAPLTGSDRSAF